MVHFESADVRVSLILPTVLRVEQMAWTDLPTQCVQFRDFGNIVHKCEDLGDGLLQIETEAAVFLVNTRDGTLS